MYLRLKDNVAKNKQNKQKLALDGNLFTLVHDHCFRFHLKRKAMVFKKYFQHGLIPPFLFVFVLFTPQFKFKKALCLGFEPWVAGWKAQTDPLSYCGPH